MSLKGFIARLMSSRNVPAEGKIKTNQSIYLRIGKSHQTFSSHVDDLDKNHLYVAGISSPEVQIQQLPHQKIRFFLLVGNHYYRAETSFVKQIALPSYQWVLTKPKVLQGFARRRDERVENIIEVDVKNYPKNPRNPYTFLTKNISHGGVLLISEASFFVHMNIVLQFPAMNDSEFLGEVVWKDKEKHNGKWHYGVQFLNLGSRQKNELCRYIARIPPSSI